MHNLRDKKATAFCKGSASVVGHDRQIVEIMPSRDDRKFVWGVLLLFAGLSVVGVLRHEMWRDELHTWSVTLRSDSILRLFQTLRYEGHGALWYLLLYPLTRLTADPFAMQILHVGLATATAGIFLRFLPLPPLARVLVVFGYFPFFEYATISRDYAIGFLLVVAFCVVATQRPDALLFEALLLVLLAQTNAYGVILAVSLAILPVTRLVGLARSRGLSAQEKKRAAVACLLFAAALVIAIKQLIPAPDGGIARAWFFFPSKKQLVQTLSTPWRGLVPVPKIQLQFWNTNFLDRDPIGSSFQASPLQAVLGTVLCLVLFLLHARRPAALLFFCFAYGGLLLFSYTKYLGDLRHQGHFWVALLAAQWLWVFSAERPLPVPLVDRLAGFWERRRYRVILTLALVGFGAGLGANATVFARTFSSSRDVARFLQAHQPDTPVVADRNYIAEPVATRLNRPFFYTMGERWGTFVLFDEAGCKFSKPEDVARNVERLSGETHRDVLILLSYPATGPLAKYEEIARYPAGIVPDERYFLYLARQPSPRASTRPTQSHSGDAHTLRQLLRVGADPTGLNP